ncbi:MAG: fructose bisphosphate aldolase [Actinobacteria bacterium]|nr:fructose bisphosphate aldolase [Actinomycetota bacterium]
MNRQQYDKVKSGRGFIAALDQSGGSTPKALKLYGIDESDYSNDSEMFDLIHQMRARIMTSPVFSGNRILGAILFEMTMDRDVDGRGTADYLWNEKNVVPFLKVDKGLEDEAHAAQLMRPMPGLDDLLDRARSKGVFGTKMRSVIKDANGAGVRAVVDQQFEIARQIIAKDLVPIIEPEIDIHAPKKADAERLLRDAMREHLDDLAPDQMVMLKLTPPEVDDFYAAMVVHPNVLRVVALSGGYSRDDANERLARQHGVIASFSRALTQGLTAQQSDQEFNETLNTSIESIYQASST